MRGAYGNVQGGFVSMCTVLHIRRIIRTRTLYAFLRLHDRNIVNGFSNALVVRVLSSLELGRFAVSFR